MPARNPRNLPDKLYRSVLIFAAAVVFGILLYWILPDVTPYVGETAAALWSWSLIVASGVAAHWLLPRSDLAPVSRVLFAVLVSAIVAMFAALVLALVVLPIDRDEIPQLLIAVGLTALAFSSIVFVPLHLVGSRSGRSVVFYSLLAGSVLPAGLVMVVRPVDPNDYLGDLLLAAFVGCIGGCSALGFAIGSAWHRGKKVADP